MAREDLAARSDEIRAASRALIRESVALRAYSAMLRRRQHGLSEHADGDGHTGWRPVPGAPDGDGRVGLRLGTTETDGDGRARAEAHATGVRGPKQP